MSWSTWMCVSDQARSRLKPLPQVLLLNDSQVRTLPWHLVRGSRLYGLFRRPVGIVREDHALSRLTRIDSQHRFHRHPYIKWHARKSRSKTNRAIAQLQVVCGRLANVQNDLAILHMFLRHRYTIDSSINNYVRRVYVVPHPFVHGADQVGSLGAAWIIIQFIISLVFHPPAPSLALFPAPWPLVT